MKGVEFNTIYKDRKCVRLTKKSLNHDGYLYKEGLHIFKPLSTSPNKAFYFCFVEDYEKWLDYRDEPMHYMFDVAIPNEAQVEVLDGEITTDMFVLSNQRII